MLQPNFPVIDLHCHLEGSIDPQKSYEILHRVGYAQAQNREEFFKKVSGFESGMQGFFGAIPFLDACLIDRETVSDVVSDIVARATEQNVKILEMSFAPRTRYKLQESAVNRQREYIEAILDGVEAGRHNRDIASA